MNNSYWLFLLATFLSPFYFFRSGLPQIADYIYIFSLIPFTLNYKKLVFLINFHYKQLIFFIIWIFINSIIWSVFLSDLTFLIAPIFYLYNFFVSSLFIFLGSNYPKKFISHLKNTLFFNNLIILILLIFLPFVASRYSGTFNNPNQLANYGLFIISTIQYLNDFDFPKKPKEIFIFLSGVIFVITSFSIAANAMLPIFILLGLSKSRLKIINLIISLILILVPFSFLYSSSSLRSNLDTRLSLVSIKTQNFIKEREYDRILKYPSYIFFGAGEGAYLRFNKDLDRKNEIHSTIGNIFFSYGLIGTFLFLSVIYKIFRPLNFNELIISFPIFFFSLFHMTLRSTFIWIFLSLLIVRKNLLSKS